MQYKNCLQGLLSSSELLFIVLFWTIEKYDQEKNISNQSRPIYLVFKISQILLQE